MKGLSKLSKRERNLAIITGVLVVGIVGFLLFQGARDRLAQLDADIETMEDELVKLTALASMREDVNAAFTQIAAEHGSDWTEAAIQDRLRREVYRLAQEDPPPPDEVVAGARSRARPLVDIRELGAGRLVVDEPGLGYRQYQLEFDVEPRATIDRLAEYIRRLEESPQALRIDMLEFSRPREELALTGAEVRVVRTIVDGTDVEGESLLAADALIENDSFADWVDEGLPEGWQADGAAVQADNLTGPGAAALLGDGGATAMSRALDEWPTGGPWQLDFDVTGSGILRVGLRDSAGAPVTEPVAIEVNGPARHRLRITCGLPPAGEPPALYFEHEGGGVARVDSVSLRRMQEDA